MPRVRTALFVLLVAGVSLPGSARADSYVWGGHVGRFSVSVQRLGFLEGAGTQGWQAESARRLAIWGRRIDRVVPQGRRVQAVMGLDDESFWLEIRDRRNRLLERIETSIGGFVLGADEYAALARILAQRFGDQVSPTPPRTRAIYTIQLAATTDRDAAHALANRLRERGVHASGSFYFETCAPCFARDPKVLHAESRGRAVYRLVSGVFDSWPAADRARQRLEHELGHEVFVRRL